MFNVPLIEYVGYAASIVVGISLIMTNMFKLRLINTVGCILFVIYGISIKAYPVAVVNFIICIINIYYLLQMRRNNEA